MSHELTQLASLFQQTQDALKGHATRAVNASLVVRNWLFGWYLVEFENANAERKELYGMHLIDDLSSQLKEKGIKGVSPTNLRKFREFFLAHQKIQQTLSVESATRIVLCKRKKDALVEITLPKDSNIHASEYRLYLPSKAELKAQIESVSAGTKK
jgi:hypothetical protein